MTCPNCQAPVRTLYPPGQRPALARVRPGNWIDLERCEPCGALWCSSPYEPYAAFEYIARWDADIETWGRIHDTDEGQTLRQWHAAMIREHWQGLAAEEQARVEQHRRRSSGHNPIDNTLAFGSTDSASILKMR